MNSFRWACLNKVREPHILLWFDEFCLIVRTLTFKRFEQTQIRDHEAGHPNDCWSSQKHSLLTVIMKISHSQELKPCRFTSYCHKLHSERDPEGGGMWNQGSCNKGQQKCSQKIWRKTETRWSCSLQCALCCNKHVKMPWIFEEGSERLWSELFVYGHTYLRLNRYTFRVLIEKQCVEQTQKHTINLS